MTETLLTKKELLALGARYEAPIRFSYCTIHGTLKPAALSWLELSHRLTTKPYVIDRQEQRDTVTDYPLFNLSRFGDETKLTGFGEITRRTHANLLSVSGIVLDVDNSPPKPGVTPPRKITLDAALAELEGYELCYYTSLNHLNPNKHNVEKFRIVLPFDAPCDLDDYKERVEAIVALFDYADQGPIKNPSQPYYLPMVYADRKDGFRAGIKTGRRFSVMELEATVKPVAPPRPAAIITDQVWDDAHNVYIRTADGHHQSAYDLYHTMREGWDDKRSCYRIDDAGDRNPGCYIWRWQGGLCYRNEDGGDKRFIRVMKTHRAEVTPPVDEPTAPLWERKKTSTPLPAAPKPATTQQPTVEWEHDTSPVRIINERYLPDDTLDIMPERGFCFIKSPKGTGKTERLKAFAEHCFKTGKRVLLIGHRIYLLRNIAERLNLDFYGDHNETTDDMAITLDSLTRVDKDGPPYDAVIIDESEQVLLHLIASTLRDRRKQVLTNLLWVLRNAKQVLCLDADLSTDATIELLVRLTGEKEGYEYRGVINNYRFTDRTTKMYAAEGGHGQAAQDIFDLALDGRRVFVACNSKREAMALGEFMRMHNVGALVLTSETNDTDAAEAFILDPSNEALKYQVVISSPTLSTGVSIEGKVFDTVIGMFGWRVGTYQDADQALSRVRQCDDVRVWVQHADTKPGKSEHAIAAEALKREEDTSLYLHGEEDKPTTTKGEEIWAQVYGRLSWLSYEWCRNKRTDFIKLRESAGYVIEDIPLDKQAAEEGKNLLNALKQVIDEEHIEKIFNAKVLNATEYDFIKAKKRKSNEEHLQLTRYRYAYLLQEDFSLTTLRQAVEEELLHNDWTITLAHRMSSEQRTLRDIHRRQDEKVAFTDYWHDARRTELLNELLAAADLTYSGLLQRCIEAQENGEVVNILPSQVGAMALHYQKNASTYSRYFKTRIKEPLARPKTVWDAVVGAYGLPLTTKRTQVNGARQSAYVINTDARALTLQVAKRLDDQ